MPPRLSITDTKDEAAKRRDIYSTLEELLNPGFVSQSVVVNGVNLAMRSLFPGEYVFLRHRLGLGSNDRLWKEWAVASSVWMVDGQSLLEDPNAAVVVRKSLRSLPKSGVDKLFSIYTTLHNRVSKAIGLIEAYCYEDHSRMLWRMAGRRSPALAEFAGVPGISTLGMNHIQRLWLAYNLAEDDRVMWQQEWAAAKLGASANSPKGVKRLNQREESERKLEDERRKRVIEKSYYEATGHHVGETQGMVVYRSVTSEDLVAEMDRWVKGEKDHHDLVIDAYKEKIRAKHEGERQRHEERMSALERLNTEVGSAGGGTDLVGYTAEQMKQIRGDEPLRRGTTVASSSDASRLYQKFVAKEILAGGIGTGGKAIPIPKEMMNEVSVSGGGTLNETIATRRVHLSDESNRGGG